MQSKEQKLKQIIVDLRMQLVRKEVRDNCPHAYYPMPNSGCETGVGCTECKRQFIGAMRAKIEEEVASL